MGGTIGFDYVALKILADSMYIATPEAMWRKIRAVESVIRKIEAKERTIDESRHKTARTVRPLRRGRR